MFSACKLVTFGVGEIGVVGGRRARARVGLGLRSRKGRREGGRRAKRQKGRMEGRMEGRKGGREEGRSFRLDK